MQNHWLFSSNNIYFCKHQKADENKSEKDGQTLELNSAHRHSQAKCQLVQTNYIKWIKLLLFLPYNKHLINQAKSVCMENRDLSRVYRPHCVHSVVTTLVKILPYTPPAQFIRATVNIRIQDHSWYNST